MAPHSTRSNTSTDVKTTRSGHVRAGAPVLTSAGRKRATSAVDEISKKRSKAARQEEDADNKGNEVQGGKAPR